MNKILYVLIAIALLFIAGCGQQSQKPADLQALLDLHNKERDSKGLEPFVLDNYLSQYAQGHAEWMAKKNRMVHSDISDLVGKYRLAGENIAWNQKDEPAVVDAWMHSRPHKANILNKNFTKVGFGMARNSKGQPYWCTNFGD
jgi:uncharacterized protein YkwD